MVKTAGMKVKESFGDRIFNIINYTVLSIALLVVIYPLYFIVIASFSDPNAVNAGKVILFPVDITWSGYERILGFEKLWTGYGNTIFYTVFGTMINITLTLTGAFALSKKGVSGRKFFMLMITFTMIFGGGLIPRYLLVKDLGLTNTRWALMIPNAMSVMNLIIARTFFEQTIPNELYEAAYIDGCSNTKCFFQIVLPLSSAIIAVVTLYYAVEHWNAFFDAFIFLKDPKLFPLQVILREILIANQAQLDMMGDIESMIEQQKAAELIKYGIIIAATLPILMVYPFLQRYFVKGVMIGAVKG